jgi:hypothetical protein
MALTDPSSVLGSLTGQGGLGTLLGGSVLGYEALNMDRPQPGVNLLVGSGQNLIGMGNTLMTEGLTGALPAADRAKVAQNTEAAQARVRSQYAHLGLSNSTMAVQAENAQNDQAAKLEGEMSLGLLKQGMAMTGVGAGDIEAAIKIQGTQLADFSKAVRNFASALGGGPPAPNQTSGGNTDASV